MENKCIVTVYDTSNDAERKTLLRKIESLEKTRDTLAEDVQELGKAVRLDCGETDFIYNVEYKPELNMAYLYEKTIYTRE